MHRKDSLHSLGVINVSGRPSSLRKDSEGAIVRTRGKFTTSRRP
jgi:hypothetical protein